MKEKSKEFIIKNIAPPKLVINLAIGVVKSEIKKVDIIL